MRVGRLSGKKANVDSRHPRRQICAVVGGRSPFYVLPPTDVAISRALGEFDFSIFGAGGGPSLARSFFVQGVRVVVPSFTAAGTIASSDFVAPCGVNGLPVASLGRCSLFLVQIFRGGGDGHARNA